MHVQFENCLTERHFLLFGRIIQSYARHEALMEEIMASVSGADATSVKLMTAHMPFGWKRAVMLNLLRHRGVFGGLTDDLLAFFEPLHDLSRLRDDIAHSSWAQTDPVTAIRPSWLNKGPKSALKPTHDIGGNGKTYFEDVEEEATYSLDDLSAIADRLDENEKALRRHLAETDLSAPRTSA